jgi:hypothetical protein
VLNIPAKQILGEDTGSDRNKWGKKEGHKLLK